MKPVLKKTVVATILLLNMHAFAAVEYAAEGVPCDPVIAEQMTRTATDELEREKERIAEEIRRKREIQGQSGPLQNAMSCIDRLKNMSVTGGLGIPNLLDALLNKINGMVCGAVDGVYAEANKQVNKSVSFPGVKGLPGTGGNGGVYVGSTGQTGVNVNGQRLPTPGFGGNTVYQTAPQQQKQAEPGLWEKTKRVISNAF